MLKESPSRGQSADPFLGTLASYTETASSYIASLPPYFSKFENRLYSGSSIIELGCATGGISEYLRKKGFSVTATDVNPAMIDKASSMYPNLHVQQMDMRKMQFPPSSFSAAVSSFSLIHISPQDIPMVMKQQRMIVKPGGSIYIAMQGVRGMKYDEGWYKHPQENNPVYLYLYSPEFMIPLLKSSGFPNVRFESVEAQIGEFDCSKDVYIAA